MSPFIKIKETDEEVVELAEILAESERLFPVERAKRKFWTDKKGNRLTFKEFMDRWKNGMRGITQYQQTKMQLNSTGIMLIGILCGFVICFFNLKVFWWLAIILGAAFFNTGVSALGLWQKKVVLGTMEKMLEEADAD